MNKLKSRRGMSVMELLCAVMIIVLIGALMSLAVGWGTKSYLTATDDAKANNLCISLSEAISEELRYAVDAANYGDTVSFVRADETWAGAVALRSVDGRVTVGGYPLIPEDMYENGMTAALTAGYTEKAGGGVFRVSLSVLGGNGKELAKSDFDVLQMNDNDIEY